MSEDTTTQALAGITWLSEQTPEALRDMLREAPPAERRELLDTMARVYTMLGEVLRLATPAPGLDWTSSEAQGGVKWSAPDSVDITLRCSGSMTQLPIQPLFSWPPTAYCRARTRPVTLVQTSYSPQRPSPESLKGRPAK